ncbi:hypothetical protein B0T14DRAFT_492675 [Immersiella caudata]|uniref:Biogenesis of lysosome-related organelles complex 1 subunit 1 n=1 Tax=Immersiella caudata TaxID=314043 RepID=A0AA39X2X9_9PEZI|nr:hypothetical protein B0T14DRAFT_492675 [Immersiella caudata]
MFSSLIPGLRLPQPSPAPASVTNTTADATPSSSAAATTSPAPTIAASSPGLPSTATPSSARSTSRATTTSTNLSSTTTTTISSQREIEEARNAVVASIGNMLDRELQGRAALLHTNNAAIEKQERDVAKARDALSKENDKLQRLAEENARKVKEIGNVQNWAEMLEREFLIMEETLRLVKRGEDGEGSWSGSGSGSECGNDCDCGRGEEGGRDGEGDVVMGVNGTMDGKGKGVDTKERGVAPEMVPIPGTPPAVDEGVGMDAVGK